MSQDFKVTTFDSTYSQRLASGDTLIGGSSGSNNVVAGDFELKNEGGQDYILAHGAMGSTETFDPTDGNVHTGTLDADCAFTLNAPTGTGFCSLELWLTQDGTGGWVITWPGSVTEIGTPDTTLSTTSRVIVESVDGGTTWLATWVGTDGGATNAELNIEGGQSVIFAHGSMGSAETFDPTDGNVHTGILNADCTFTLGTPSGSGASLLELRITATGTHTWTWPGSVTWVGGTTPAAPADTATSIVLVETLDLGSSWVGVVVGGGTSSPLTTKGDIYSYGSNNARFPVGANGSVLTSDSTQTLGLRWAPNGGSPLTTKGDLYTYSTTTERLAIGSNGTGLIADSAELTGNRWTLQALSGELLMADGVTGPPVPIESDPAQNDWLYADL